MTRRGHLFVLSGPAGAGKTTLVTRLTEEFEYVVESVSCTTRPARSGEIEGEHYHFLSQQSFESRLLAGDFIEHAKIFGHYYGTARQEVDRLLAGGLYVFLVIDTQGAQQVRHKIPCTSIFLSPPSMAELRSRLAKRRTESNEAIERRLRWAAEYELQQIQNYDYHIVNDDLDEAYDHLRSIVIAQSDQIES